eukprot:4938286-Amphidinium_carterae.3
MTSTVGSLLGVPITTRLTLGMINVNSTEQRPTPAAEARASLRMSQENNPEDDATQLEHHQEQDNENNLLNTLNNILQFKRIQLRLFLSGDS